MAKDLILLAEDAPDIAKVVEITLAGEGFQVVTASNGAEALEMAFEQRPDLILLDVMMPKMGGLEVCERLRADIRTRNVPIIMLTGQAKQAPDRVKGLNVGADDYIVKPYHGPELIGRIRSNLTRSREMRSANPLTQLPGSPQIEHEVTSRIRENRPFALLYIDIDYFKAYNDYYGFARGDDAIKLLSLIAGKIVMDTKEGFMGHVGGDDFVAITDPWVAEDVANEILHRWGTESVNFLYREEDLRRGYIEVLNRQRNLERYELCSVSIGIASSDERRITSYAEASALAGEMKSFAKKQEGSYCAFDRRAEAPTTQSH